MASPGVRLLWPHLRPGPRRTALPRSCDAGSPDMLRAGCQPRENPRPRLAAPVCSGLDGPGRGAGNCGRRPETRSVSPGHLG